GDEPHGRLEVLECLAHRGEPPRLVDQLVSGLLDDQGHQRGNRQLTIGDDGEAVSVSADADLCDDGGGRLEHQCATLLPFTASEASATMRVPSLFELRTPKVPPLRSSRSRLPSSPRPRPSLVRLTTLGENPMPLS